MMHPHVGSRPDEGLSDINSVMCLFWELEASSCALYQQMAVCEPNPFRAEGWRRLQNCRLLRGESPANQQVYLDQKLLSSCLETIRHSRLDSTDEGDPFLVISGIMQIKFLQVTLIAALRQQASVMAMIDIETFDNCVAQATHLALSSRGV